MSDHCIFTPTISHKHGDRLRWGNLAGSASSLAVVNAAQQAENLSVLITNDTASAIQLEQELRFYSHDLEVLHLPDWETLPYDSFSPHEDIISERLTTLHRLKNMHKGLLIIPISTLMHRLLPQSYIDAHTLQIKIGDTFDIDVMRIKFEASGYRCVDTVYEHGEFALRGAIMDIYPMGSKLPYRIDLMGDEIDTLRTFDPESQRTVKQVKEISLLPGKEFPLDKAGIAKFRNQWHQTFDVDHSRCPIYQDVSQGIAPAGIEYYLPLFFDQCSTLLDYLPQDALLFSFEGLDRAAEQFWRDLHTRYDDLNIDPQRPLLNPQRVFIPTVELFAGFKQHLRIVLFKDGLAEKPGSNNFASNPPPFLTIDNKSEQPLAALKQLTDKTGSRLLLCAESAGRRETLIELLGRNKIQPKLVGSWHEFMASDHPLAITIGNIDSGLFLAEQHIYVVAESQLFGQQVMQSRRRRKATDSGENIVKNLSELTIGAPVVHLDHGVGRYHGLQSIDAGGINEEFITLEYADGAKLYVPVSSLDLISRYSGADQDNAPLHRLGSDSWSKAKRKAAEKIRDVAAELLNIYARRAARPGQSFNIPEQDYQQFSAAFPFEETPDQQQAIEAVVADMRADTATDRLVCGDVGFGKTEVAMRAAFVAAHNNKQVVVLVPTTLLAQQHYQSFQDRFADWPVNIEVLSRFKTPKQQQVVIEKT
ncbi:MAG: transcription-repair coupling factor (superfamily II helicase), partial [Pseudohongiellaceae bacterium]